MAETWCVWFRLDESEGSKKSPVDKVTIRSTADVADFRKAVKAKCPNTLKGIDAFNLKFFFNAETLKANSAVEEDAPITGMTKQANKLASVDAEELVAYETYNAALHRAKQKEEDLNHPPLEVDLLLGGLKTSSANPLIVLVPNLPAPSGPLLQGQSRIFNYPPSTTGQSVGVLKSIQSDDYPLRFGRPFQKNVPFPVDLLFEGFSDLIAALAKCKSSIDDCQLDRVVPFHSQICWMDLFASCCDFFDVERDRMNSFCKAWNRLFPNVPFVDTGLENKDSLQPGGVLKSRSGFIAAILEVKNEIYTSGDPVPQFLSYAARLFTYQHDRHSQLWHTVCPMLGIVVMGSRLEVYALAITARIHSKPILQLDFSIGQFEYIIKAISIIVDFVANNLDAYYNQLQPTNLPVTNRMTLEVPYVLHGPEFSQRNQITDLVYSAHHQTHQAVVCKFSRRYSREVHDFCSAKGIAPRLYDFQKLDCGYHMIIMEDLSPGYQQLNEELIGDPAVEAAVREALRCLHEGGFVHGDFRYPNIHVKWENGKWNVKLIDFEWSARSGAGSYPLFLSPTVQWHHDVKPGDVLDKKHDLFMIDNMLAEVQSRALKKRKFAAD